ncbi:hypothetical protein [Phenylobacterium sp.]|uniref:hypothetical protein n=1 Tax=Phenylobacterium sp. TaxID=1871053 RepID=UPI0012141A02|nr:hypothetical protein [Phenylobacterium sp.]THD58245.1 MAG: hypothetical protein E8A49_19885 [Phenylobacterium sp.]
MTRTSVATALVAVLTGAMALSACDRRHDLAANPKVCADFKTSAKPGTASPAATLDPGAAPVDECVRRWAYALAPSHDPAGAVAQASVVACMTQLARWNRQTLAQPGSDLQADSLTTGQPTTPLAEHSTYTAGRALFYVVQARAGLCAAPPMTNGVPDGISVPPSEPTSPPA